MASAGIERQRFRGDRLSAARENLKVATKGRQGSQAWLAFRIGAHVTSVSDWERGANEPSARYAAAICAIPELSLSLAELFGSDDDDEEAARLSFGRDHNEMLTALAVALEPFLPVNRASVA